MSSAENFDRIERYLQGAMTPGELDKFTTDLAADSTLASEVDLHRELGETLAGEKVHQFRQVLQEVDAAWKPRAGGGLHFLLNPRILAIAASLLLLVGFFTWMSLKEPNYQRLATTNFEQLHLQTQMRGGEQGNIDLRNRANQAYFAENYAGAAPLFLELAGREPENLKHHLYAGISQFGNKEADAAIATLRPLAESDDPAINGEARWFLALALLFTEAADPAEQLLARIVQEKGYNWEKAQALLGKL